MQSDPFSDLLRLTRARLVGTGGFAVRGTWGFRVAAPRQIVLAAVAHGSCWLRLEHHAPMRLEHGDVGLLSGRSSIVTANAPSGPTIDVPLVDKGGRVERMSDTPDCILLAGRIALDRANEALLSGVLPPYILVRASSPRAAGLRALVEQLLDEQTSALPGSRVASEKIAELLFIQVLRAHVATSDGLPPGWLAAVTDRRVIRALRLMHDEPGRGWTVDALATAAGMSRTRFAIHFRAVAGVTPLAYLGAWRMRLAQRVLLEEDAPVRVLAETLGYGSESAFSHAFKRITGLTPRDYRVTARREAGLASLPRTGRANKFSTLPRIRAGAAVP